MTPRERILAVYRGETPDCVPFMLDLQHWFYHRHHLPWNLRLAYAEPERQVLDYHRRLGIGFYMPNLAAFFSVEHAPGVALAVAETSTGGVPTITWQLSTPHGSVHRARVWQPQSYSWGLVDTGVRTEADLRVLGEGLAARRYQPHWDRYQRWAAAIGNAGVIYLPLGYSGMGQLLNAWMGVESTMYAVYDWPQTIRDVVNQINDNNLELVDLAAKSPADVVLLGDNFSSNLQPPEFFAAWSAAYYQEVIRRLHAAGKFVAVHIDGKLRGALRMIREAGADCADAVTPVPMGDLTPAECRDEAGDSFILSGGISPDLFLPAADDQGWQEAARRWLEQRHRSPRLMIGVGDEVPLGVPEERLTRLRDLVEAHGRYD